MPDGDLHPDLVNRIAGEAARTAQSILTMCIRAFDYLPPVDITFGDYLRALVTADFELAPADEAGQRAAMIESFRARGIYPDNVTSLAEESLLWESYEPGDLPLFPIHKEYTLRRILDDAYEFSRTTAPRQSSYNPADEEREADLREDVASLSDDLQEESLSDLMQEIRMDLMAYVQDPTVAAKLSLDPQRKINVLGFHPVFRVAPHGQLLVEIVAQFAQKDDVFDSEFGGVPLRGGTTVVAAADGTVRYAISKPLGSRALSEGRRGNGLPHSARRTGCLWSRSHREARNPRAVEDRRPDARGDQVEACETQARREENASGQEIRNHKEHDPTKHEEIHHRAHVQRRLWRLVPRHDSGGWWAAQSPD